MAILKDTIINGACRVIGDAYFNTIKSGVWNGSAIPVTNGGTGATTAANARTNLGLSTAATHAHGDYMTNISWDATNNKLNWKKGDSNQTAITIGYATVAGSATSTTTNKFTWTEGRFVFDPFDRRITNTTTRSSWDSQVYSNQGYANGCRLSFRAGQANKPIMVGLNTDPATNASYNSIDFCFYLLSNGGLNVYTNGSSVSLASGQTTYSAGDSFEIIIDYQKISNNLRLGRIRFYHNEECVLISNYEGNSTSSGAVWQYENTKFYFDSSFNNGGYIYDVEFEPRTCFQNNLVYEDEDTLIAFNIYDLPGNLSDTLSTSIYTNGPSELFFNYKTKDNKILTDPIEDIIFCSGTGFPNYSLNDTHLATLTAKGFAKSGSSSSYLLTGDGGHLAISTLTSDISSSVASSISPYPMTTETVSSNGTVNCVLNSVYAYTSGSGKIFVLPNVTDESKKGQIIKITIALNNSATVNPNTSYMINSLGPTSGIITSNWSMDPWTTYIFTFMGTQSYQNDTNIRSCWLVEKCGIYND